MKFIGHLLLSIVITFVLVSLGWWIRIMYEIFNKFTEGQIGFLVVILAFGLAGIVLALTGLFLI